MFQINGKTRRGRPPKYQQYWISLAMEKAAQRAMANGKGANGKTLDGGTDDNPELKDDGATKEARPQQQENNAAIQKEDKSPDQPCNSHLKRRSNSWPFNENVKESVGGHTDQCNRLPGHKLLSRNNNSSATGSREAGFQFVKKFKPEDVPCSEHYKSLNALCSTWNDKVFGCEVPFLVAGPSKQVTQNVVQTSELNLPESQLGSSEGSNLFPKFMLNSAGIVKTDSFSGGRGCFYDSPLDSALGQFITTEMSESALDLSSKLQQPGEGNEDNFNRRMSPEFVSVEKPALPNVAEENRQLLNVVQPWNTGQLRNEAQPWNGEKIQSKHEHDAYSVEPKLRAFPCSGLAEVSMWSVDEVAQFVSMIPGCHEYAQCFREEDIDGLSFLQLSESHLRNVIRMKLGPSLHLKKALDDLASFGFNAAA